MITKIAITPLLALLGLTVTAFSKPNVVFIAIDDLRPELGCYGHDHIISPNIDQLAKEGLRFDRAYCQQSVCNPSRASILTGLRPDATQVHGNHTHYRDIYPDIVTLPQHFKNHGYHTQAFGKIYHGVFPEGSSKTVADTYGDPLSWSVPAYRPGPRYYYTEDGMASAKQAFLAMYRPVDPDPNDWKEKLVFGPMTEAPDVPDETLYDGLVAKRATETLRHLAQKDQPFFLAVGFIKPHSPFIAPKKYWDLYDPSQIDLAPRQSAPAGTPKMALHGSGEIRRYMDQPSKGAIPEANQRRMKHGYAACISYVDAQVGKVLSELDQLGLREKTIVVLWSDHGYHLGEKNLWGKTTNFELDTRVAMIVHAPDRSGNGQATNALVELVDLYPTLADLAELPSPKHSLQGLSFSAVLEDPSRSWKQAAFSQFTRRGYRGYSLTDGRYRYTEWIHSKSGDVSERELYDHKVDPGERRNLVGVQGQQENLSKLKALLNRGEGWRQASPPELQLGKPFGSHMVLQRDKRVPVFGRAVPGESVNVTFGGQEHTAVADTRGKWLIILNEMSANSLPQELVVRSGNATITLKDVLVGEVWLCAGQSNMRWMLQQSKGAKQAIAAASNPNIRLLDFTGTLYPKKKRYSLGMLRSIGAGNYYATEGWRRCSPETAATFSAVAYYFGDRLQSALEVPVGLIHNAVGGVSMESYIPTTNASGWLDDPNMPAWCRERGRDNLAAWLDKPASPAPHHPFEPGFLFEAGMRPLLPMALRGFLWYQGESNATASGAGSPAIDPAANKKKFVSLINAWRKAW
ncbi:MAG: sulfatase, partial [Verrucomicrobiales bacterium]|nr:sulfatase [Verrucomicrobiales bacterium]